MTPKILIDTSPIVALLSSRDTSHQICVETLKNLHPPLITCWPVLTEVLWLIRQNKIAINALFTMIEGDLLQVIHLPKEAIPWLKNYLLKYSDIGAQIADVSLCYLAETQKTNTIFTLDRRDFSIYRINGNQAFTIMP